MIPVGKTSIFARTKSVITNDRIGGYTGQD